MRSPRMLYLSSSRIPTEKAHGFQIIKMCDAFAAAGVDVALWHPRRSQKNPALDSVDPYDYFNVQRSFRIRTLWNWDVLRLEGLLPTKLFMLVFVLHSLLWGLIAAGLARGTRPSICYTREPALALALIALRLPTVYEAHVVPGGVNRFFLRLVMRSPFLRGVVCLTRYIKEGLVDAGLDAEASLVAGDAVDLKPFVSLPDREACRTQLGLKPRATLIGYVGRLQTLDLEKGVSELVQALAYLPKELEHAALVCVGGPLDSVEKYLTVADDAGVPRSRVTFVDRVPTEQVGKWMRACDVVTIPWPYTTFSAFYTSPLKLFEYMASGVPIVASDLPALREVLTDGVNARLVSPGDPARLAAGIAELLLNPALAASLATMARRDVENQTWVERARRILTFIEREVA